MSMGGDWRKESKLVHPNAPEFYVKGSACLGTPILPYNTMNETQFA